MKTSSLDSLEYLPSEPSSSIHWEDLHPTIILAELASNLILTFRNLNDEFEDLAPLANSEPPPGPCQTPEQPASGTPGPLNLWLAKLLSPCTPGKLSSWPLNSCTLI